MLQLSQLFNPNRISNITLSKYPGIGTMPAVPKVDRQDDV